MKFVTSVLSNMGGRNRNEDFTKYLYNDSSFGAWILADGLGGHRDGQVASKIAAETALNQFELNSELTVENIKNIFYTSNNAVIDYQKDQKLKMGMRTTMVGLFTDLKRVLWAHVGDSRLYFFRRGIPIIQTKDHSVAQMIVSSGEISPDRIRFHEDRNKLLRVLGNQKSINVEVSNNFIEVQDGDAFLICSDGFWEMVYELEMEIDLCKSESPDQWISYMVERLYNRVNEHFDNFSAIAVFVKE